MARARLHGVFRHRAQIAEHSQIVRGLAVLELLDEASSATSGVVAVGDNKLSRKAARQKADGLIEPASRAEVLLADDRRADAQLLGQRVAGQIEVAREKRVEMPVGMSASISFLLIPRPRSRWRQLRSGS